MNSKRANIICVGNPFVESDNLGRRVYDCLARQNLPGDIALIDGGLGGLDLLRFVEGVRRAVFVDAVNGFAPPGQPVILDHAAVLAERPAAFGHSGGLAYLLRILPAVCGDNLPEISLVGAESPVESDVVGQLADIALSIATGGRNERGRNAAIVPAQPGTP